LDLAGPAMNRQGNGTAANAAIFHQGLLALRRVDEERKRFSAMRTGDFCFVDQFHCRVSSNIELNCGVGRFWRPLNFGVVQFAEMQLTDAPAIRL
jgi:hypothetical protein